MNTDRIRCSEVRERLPLYMGGDLDPDVLEGVATHLAGCGECSKMADDALHARRELVAAFRAGEAELPRAELWPAIRAQLCVEGLIRDAGEVRPAASPVLQAVPARKARLRWTRILAPLAAAAALIAVVQLSGLSFSSGSGASRPDPVTPKGVPDVAVTPVDSHTGLQRVDPREATPMLPLQYRRARQGSVPGEVSAASYLPPQSR